MERLPVGKIIQGLRKAKGITQEELAEVLGVSSAAISKWENGQMYPDITLFPVIARYFNISIDYLFGFSNDLSEEEYLKNRQECIKLFASGKCLNGMERIKRLVYLYPTNDRIKIDLLKNVLPYLALEKDSEIRENLIRQMILICQRCIDDSVQSQKHFLLAHLFIMIKKYEDASACLVDENEFMAIDMKNSLILRENNANAIDIIDSTINMLGIQLIYELRNKVSYWIKNDLTYTKDILEKQCTLITVLGLSRNLYFMVYMNMAYVYCLSSQKNAALELIQKFITMYKENPIKDSMLINVFVSGFSSQPFDIIRKTSAFIELNQILEEYL